MNSPVSSFIRSICIIIMHYLSGCRVAVGDFPSAGVHVFPDRNHNANQTVAVIARPLEVFQTVAVARSILRRAVG